MSQSEHPMMEGLPLVDGGWGMKYLILSVTLLVGCQKTPPAIRDAYFCGKSAGVEQSNPNITFWTDREHIREKFNCDKIDTLIGLDPLTGFPK